MVWGTLFTSDYCFTLACARMYQSYVKEKIVFEGSFELTPFYQKDVDSLRKFSPRFILVLALYCLLLSIIPMFLGTEIWLWEFLLGTLVLLQLAIHVRHFRNYFLFRVAGTDALRGRLEYDRWLTLQVSAVEIGCFSAIFLLLAFYEHSCFLAGGATTCFTTAIKHWTLSRKSMAEARRNDREVAAQSAT